MKRFILLAILFLFTLPAFAGDQRLDIDGGGVPIQSFIPDPAKSQVNTTMTGTIVAKKGTGQDINITGWIAIKVVPSAASTYYFNSDTTKTFPLFAGVENIIMVGSVATSGTVNLVFGAATASIQGM
jgi:hypothetical protein